MGNGIDKYLSQISDRELAVTMKKMVEQHDYLEQLKRDGFIFNTDTSKSLDIIRESGFNPIGITCLMLEETFIFDTSEEANRAYEKLEVELGSVSGFWYAKDDFLKSCEFFRSDYDYIAKIYWL